MTTLSKDAASFSGPIVEVRKRRAKPPPPSKVEARRRMAPESRQAAIVEAAIQFFTEEGFGGQTRELAKRLGITQPLLYRYFASKEALIERVYQEVFVGRWNPAWEDLLRDRTIPIEDRLNRFYASYAQVILTPVWVRLFMFAGLKGLDFNARYLRMLRDRIFVTIVDELRHAAGRAGVADVPASEEEIEMIWSLHAAIFYLGVRQFIYRMPIDLEIGEIIEAQIRTLLHGITAVLAAPA